MKHYTTIGLWADVPGYEQRKLVKIPHYRTESGQWKVYVVSARNLSTLKKCGAAYLDDDEIRPLFDDDNVKEFKNLAALFGITA